MCPRCRSRRSQPRTRREKRYVAGDHQPYESTAGWVYGHEEVLVSYRSCLDCGEAFGDRRKVERREKAAGSARARVFGGYGTD